MRILLVNAIDHEKKTESMFAPLGLGYLASYARELFPDVEIKIIDNHLQEHLKDFRPDLVGISSVTQNFDLARQYAKLAKSQDIPIIVGGTHISTVPANLTPDMDLGVIGEGEETFTEIIKTVYSDGWDLNKIKRIKGLVVWKEDGSVEYTGHRQPIEPLDKLPFPARDMLNINKGAACYVFSSRGCPYRCVFCASSRFWPKIRAFSPSYVVLEIKNMIDKYRPSLICFYDDLFVFSKPRLREIVKLIKAEGIDDKVEFAVSARANLIDNEVTGLLKQMNVVHVNMGLESGCEATLKFLKPNVTLEQNKLAVETLNTAGLIVNASFVIGSPMEKKSEIAETLKFIKDRPFNHVYVYILTPLPGTPVWDYALERGLVDEHMDWSRLAMEAENVGNYVHLSEVISREELYKLYEDFNSLARKKRVKAMVSQVYRNPHRIIPYFTRRLSAN